MIVEDFLAAMVAHDWTAMGACVTDDLVRIGPYRDECRGRDAYVEFISSLLPTLPGYSMDVGRVTYVGDLAFAELSETVVGVRTDEALVFEIRDDRIARVDVYIKVRPSELRT